MFESSTPPHGSATAGASPPNAGEINEDEELLIDFDDDHESQKPHQGLSNSDFRLMSTGYTARDRLHNLLDDEIELPVQHNLNPRENASGIGFPSPSADYAPFNPYTFSQSPARIASSQAQNVADVIEPLEHDREDSPPPPIQSRTNSNQVEKYQCGQCDEHKSDSYYCNLCDMTYCGGCWNRVGPHRSGKLGPGGIPHEKTDQVIANKLRATLEASATDLEQQELFRNDENTAWFGVVKDESEDSVFYDYGRYADIMTEISQATSPKQANQRSRFPGLVSFVGETGAGKSTLVKVLIELSESGGDGHQTPIVGSVAHSDTPTSGDVHLYCDPETYLSESPIFYADCEGLAGGEREPKGARSKLLNRMAGNTTGAQRSHTTKSFERTRRNFRHSEREIKWANTAETQTRQFFVTQLYPRLLYTFSDVVVFVLKNPRVIENVIEKLIEWAAAALEMSSNQPVLPHAVIALNASELNIVPEQWDVNTSTSWLMDSVQGSLTQNVLFKKHTQIWRNRGRKINTVKDLLLSYYSTVTVVRIPANGRPKLMKDQVEKLYGQIIKSTEAARKIKRDLRMLLDGGELQTYLQFAFDHFSSNLDQAFDFVQASFIYNPIPSDFAGNILKLAVGMMERWEHELDGKAIFTELSHMVASCIMLDSARNKTRGSAELIFPEYVESCDNALEDFCDRYWPCEYVMKVRTKRGKEVGGRCVNVRSGHGSKGHQFKNGKVIAVGNYVSSFSAESFQEVFRYLVFTFLKELLSELRKTIFTSQPEDKVAAQIHKTQVMRPFYVHVNRGLPPILGSHSACFCCLMASPEHALPCGHVLCTACLIAYGQREERDAIEITSCPLHSGRTFRWMVYLKPEAAGVRVLTLDGGGIRGIVELEILRLIENVWGGGLRIQDFFDLIVGTSTGGLIALGLAAKDWTVEDCIYHFTDLCEKAFTRRVGMNIPGMSMIVESLHQSKYETAPLQHALQQAFSAEEFLFGGPRVTNHRTKVAVTATNSGSVSVLANYNRNCVQKVPYTFQRPEKLASELKIWEAARATSAAPRIFKPFSHEASKQVYVDGAVYHNNPIHVADLERRLLWPSDGHNVPDFVLSIGTAYNPNSRKKLIEKSSMTNVGIFGHAKSLASIAMDHIRSSLDSEKTWQDFILQIGLPREYQDRYQRINPHILEDPPALDDVHRMKSLQSTVRTQMTNDPSIISAAYRLLATSFYFEKTSPVIALASGSLNCTGMIRCRLPRATLSDLGRFLGSSHERSEGPYFVIRERNRPQDAKQIFITSDTLTTLTFKRKWHMKAVQIYISNPIAQTEIVLCIKRNEEFPISGFPRTLQEEDIRSNGIRHRPSTANQRWRNRTLSQQNRRKKWIEPSTPKALLNTKANLTTLASYSMPDYIVASSTPEDLAVTADRLGHNLAPLPVELSAVEGLIYEMADTSVPLEMEGSIPVVVSPPVIEQDETAPSPYAMPRRPPRVYPYMEPGNRTTALTDDAANQSEQIESIQQTPEQYEAYGTKPEFHSSLHPADVRNISPLSSIVHSFPYNDQFVSPLSSTAQSADTNHGVAYDSGYVKSDPASFSAEQQHRQHEARVALERSFYKPPSNPVIIPKASSDSTSSWATTISPPPTISESVKAGASPTFGSILGESSESIADPKATNTKEKKSNKFRRMFSS